MADQHQTTTWTFGLLSENGTGMSGLSVRQVYNRPVGREIWWPQNATAHQIAEQLRELANSLEAGCE